MELELHRSWGAKVKRRRCELGLTQQELAARAGVRQATISRIERGQGPSDALKWRLAGALLETVEHLFPYPAVRPPMSQQGAA